MKNLSKSICSLTFAAIMASCGNEVIIPTVEPQTDDAEIVQFEIGQTPETRTVFADGKGLNAQLHWLSSDQIYLSTSKSIGGTVYKEGNTYSLNVKPDGMNALLANYNAQPLHWFSSRAQYFHGAYPAQGEPYNSSTEEDSGTGIFVFNTLFAQNCPLIIDDNHRKNSPQMGDYYLADINMNNAYMVTYNLAAPQNGAVKLNFSNLNNMLQVGIQAPGNSNVEIYGMEIVRKSRSDDAILNFPRQIKTRRSAATFDITDVNPVPFSILVKTSPDNNAVSLPAGKKAVLTAFLPPMNYGNENDYLEVTILAKGFTKKAAIGKKSSGIFWEKHQKKHISLSALTPYTDPGVTTRDWIKSVPGLAKVRNLSLPGTHISMFNKQGQVGSGIQSATQDDIVLEQLNKGIRVFDLRVAEGGYDFRTAINHEFKKDNFTSSYGLTDAKVETQVLFNMIQFLDSHPDEFIVVILSRERGDGNIEKVINYLRSTTLPNNATTRLYTGSLTNDLTVKDVRGKILVLVRSDANSTDATSSTPANDSWYTSTPPQGVGFITNWRNGPRNNEPYSYTAFATNVMYHSYKKNLTSNHVSTYYKTGTFKGIDNVTLYVNDHEISGQTSNTYQFTESHNVERTSLSPGDMKYYTTADFLKFAATNEGGWFINVAATTWLDNDGTGQPWSSGSGKGNGAIADHNNQNTRGKMGMILMDFPNTAIIEKIIKNNLSVGNNYLVSGLQKDLK